CVNNIDAVTVLPAHIVSVPFVPALGCACSVTVTVAVASTVHGAVAVTVYVYIPAPASAGDHEPPASGVPPNCANNCDAVTVLPAHIVSVPFVPALGCACSVTVTVAVASTVHGAIANTVPTHRPSDLSAGDHEPPASGEPPSCANNCDAVTVLP